MIEAWGLPQLEDIRVALAAALSDATGIQASPWMLAMPTPPTAQIVPDEASYDLTFARGHDQIFLRCEVFVPLEVDITSQKNLDPFIFGSTSVKTSLEADKTLGGLVDDLRVESFSGYTPFTRQDGTQFLGCTWRVALVVPGA